jgi:hypothetical protein
MYERPVLEGRPLLRRVKKGMLLMLLPAVAMGIAGFLVPSGSKTDDGFPMNYFYWGMAAFWALTDAVMLVIALRLEVNDGFRGLYETIHREAIPVEELSQLKPGSEMAIRASRTKKGKLLLLLKQNPG